MADYESTDSLERPEDLEKDPAGVVRRWVLELKLADKREDDWRKKAEKVWNRYRQKESKKHSFNILWSNTETLRPAVYNSLPKPDVRRRWKDEDPLGKQVSTVLSRALEYGLDTTDFNKTIENSVLDMLLPGRGVARVRYVPSFEQVGVTPETHEEENEQHELGGEALEGETEEVSWEQAPIEHVQWDDFRIGAGKNWNEICWIAFRHRFTRDELVEKFGEDIGNAVKLDKTDDDDVDKERDEKTANAFRTAEVWEIWDKDEREVVFVCLNHKDEPLQTIPDPLNLIGFFPVPRPLYAIEDSSSLVPVPLYELYREQAEELDRISGRINKIVDGLRLRGVYDATLSELSELMKGQDNDFIPAQNVTALLERGGLDKAIWSTDNIIKSGAQVLQILQLQRDASKQIIYEITGIADIIRGASVATETATAQQIKDKWGSMRLRKIQSEVARFICDLIRIQAEIIGEKFAPETLETMTGVKLPHQVEVDQMMQQAMLQAQQSGQPMPQQPPPVTWEAVMQVLRDDKQRSFKIDVETDSTIAASLEGDMQALQQVLQGVTQLMQGMGPAVQMGALPVEALKEMILAVTRRAKLGNAVEDALEKMQQPPPPQQQQDSSLQVAQMKAQSDAQKHQAELQARQAEQQQTAQLEQAKFQAQQQADADKAQVQAQIEQFKAEQTATLETQRLEFDRWKAQLDAETKIVIAELQAKTSLKQTSITTNAAKEQEGLTELDDEGTEQPTSALAGLVEAINTNLQALIETQGAMHSDLVQRHENMTTMLSRPKKVIRGPDGRIAGVH